MPLYVGNKRLFSEAITAGGSKMASKRVKTSVQHAVPEKDYSLTLQLIQGFDRLDNTLQSKILGTID
jgi:hypothetical protein